MNAHPLSSVLLLALACAAGCTDEKKQPVADADAGVQGPQKPVLDSKLAAAVQAAESASPSNPSKDGADGPPESGVFGPGLADKALPPGRAYKLDVLGDGKEPRVLLTPAPADEQKEGVSLNVRLSQGSIPGEFSLALKVDKPKDDKKSDGPKSTRVVGKITSAQGPANAPRDLSEKLGKLKGSEVRYTLGPDGAVTDTGFTPGKDAEAGLGDLLLKPLVNAIGVSMPPFPSKPMGLGGFWMVADRATTFGIEVIRYRVYKIERLDKDGASFSVDVRQYAVKEEADLGTLSGGQKMTLQRFESSGKGKLDWTAAGLLPVRGETSVRTGFAGLTGGQQGVLQTEVTARFAPDAGDKKK